MVGVIELAIESSISQLLGRVWRYLVVLATTAGGYLIEGREVLTLPAKTTMTVLGAVLGLLCVLAHWAYLDS